MILIIDNYDSFTYNIVYYFQKLKQEVLTIKNDKISLNEILKIKPNYICLSPGPGRPENSGICIKLLKFFFKNIPILGICLGHQIIGKVFGGIIIKSNKIMHGKISKIFNNKQKIFKNLPNSFNVVRYHSLSISNLNFPKNLEITAYTKNKEIMAISHKIYNIHGLQFHPESILSCYGYDLLKNFLIN